MHYHGCWSDPFVRLTVLYIFIVWYKCYNQWDQQGHFCGISGSRFGQAARLLQITVYLSNTELNSPHALVSIFKIVWRKWRKRVVAAQIKSRTSVFHPRKICQFQSWEHTLALPKSTLIEIFCKQYTDAWHVYVISCHTFGPSKCSHCIISIYF